MTIKEFVEAYKAKRFMNINTAAEEKAEWLRNELEIKTYIPFRKKREIAEMIVAQNIKIVDGVKRYNLIDGYVSFIVASLVAHTSLEFSSDPVADYDLLAESHLLSDILAEFAESHQEVDLILHMVLDMELEDNKINAIISRFLNKISEILDGVVDMAKNKFEDLDFSKILGSDFSEEDLAAISSFLNKMK